MSTETSGEVPPEILRAQEKRKISREEVEGNESLENVDLREADLSGLNLEGKNFSGSDIRGLKLYTPGQNEQAERKTNIRHTLWRDVLVAETSGGTDFRAVDAEGAEFGFTEDLITVRDRNHNRHAESGVAPTEKELNAYYLFCGDKGNFAKTMWKNIHFGGRTGLGMEAYFQYANFTEAVFDACDLSDVDFSTATLENIRIVRPVSMEGMKIHISQVGTLVSALELQDNAEMQNFFLDVEDLGEKEALEQAFGIEVVE